MHRRFTRFRVLCDLLVQRNPTDRTNLINVNAVAFKQFSDTTQCCTLRARRFSGTRYVVTQRAHNGTPLDGGVATHPVTH
jgi:hypothetical protein